MSIDSDDPYLEEYNQRNKTALDGRKSRAGVRNVFIYPEKQTPAERLSARITTCINPYLNEDINDDDFDDLLLEIKSIGGQFLKEVKGV